MAEGISGGLWCGACQSGSIVSKRGSRMLSPRPFDTERTFSLAFKAKTLSNKIPAWIRHGLVPLISSAYAYVPYRLLYVNIRLSLGNGNL